MTAPQASPTAAPTAGAGPSLAHGSCHRHNLVVVTDHKALVKIFGDRTLDEITNSRLFRLKQRTLPWRFDIRHLPGKSNHAAASSVRTPRPPRPSQRNARQKQPLPKAATDSSTHLHRPQRQTLLQGQPRTPGPTRLFQSHTSGPARHSTVTV